MANPPEGLSDDFLEQILSMPSYPGTDGNLAGTAMGLQLGSGDGSGQVGYQGAVFPLGLSLEQGKSGFSKPEDASGSGKRFREDAEGKASGKMVSGVWFLLDGSAPGLSVNLLRSYQNPLLPVPSPRGGKIVILYYGNLQTGPPFHSWVL